MFGICILISILIHVHVHMCVHTAYAAELEQQYLCCREREAALSLYEAALLREERGSLRLSVGDRSASVLR